MKTIYAIAGRAGAGKDTTASMLAFLHHGYIVDGESYNTWLHADLTVTNRHIFHFADSLKFALKIIYGLENFHLRERKYKDELYFDLNTHQFIQPKEIKVTDNVLNIERIEEFGLRKVLDSCNLLGYRPLIKIRTLLQYFGTNICRNLLDDHIWTNSTITKLNNMLTNVDDVYIADMRFKEELSQLIRYANNTDNVKLVSIFITRPDNDCTIKVDHQSENIYLPCQYTINNDGTLEELFDKVKDIYHENN